MFRICIICGVWLLGVFYGALSNGALAETSAQRGDYLVNTIMACGNCHSPRDANGKVIAEKAFSGGLTFDTPAFVATAPNITPDVETGIGSWSDAEIKRALVEGMRPDHGQLAGVPLAAIMPANFYKALLPDDLNAIVAYLRTIKPVRNEVTDPVYKAAVHRDPYPAAEAGFSKAMFTDPVGRGAYLVTIGHCMECHTAWSRGVSDFKTGLGRGGRMFPAPDGTPGSYRRQYHIGPHQRPRRLERCRNRPRHYPRDVSRWAAAQAADGVHFLCSAEANRRGRHYRLSAYGAAAAMKPS